MTPAELKLEPFSTFTSDMQAAAVTAEAQGVADAPPGSEGSRGTVLVVDDEPAIVGLLSDFLGIQGFAVLTAGGGLQALGRLETELPDAVLLDVRMPDMDGIETLKRIVARKTGVPVLMVSANDDLALAKEAIALGAYDYILKPIDFGYLGRALDRMTRQDASAVAGEASSPGGLDGEPTSSYDLALEVCRVTRTMSRNAQRSVGGRIERIALDLVRQGPGAERRRLLRTLNELRSLMRFSKDLGDISDEVHRRLESHIVRVRRILGVS